MEIQQSPLYARYIKDLGWTVENLHGSYIFIKRFPLLGGLAKIQRIKKFPRLSSLIALLHAHGVRRVTLEPDSSVSQIEFTQWAKNISTYFRLLRSPFLPTKTILVDLKKPEAKIFQTMTEAKRRAVRRALKHGVYIQQSKDIDTFLLLKNKTAGLFGGITTYGVKQLWQTFSPNKTSILLAYRHQSTSPIGGILLLFNNTTAYYWVAGATKLGKKLFAPTLLVWEALKLSKNNGCRNFDFVGVWDERRKHNYREWKGFTKFKQGFGGYEVYYPIQN